MRFFLMNVIAFPKSSNYSEKYAAAEVGTVSHQHYIRLVKNRSFSCYCAQHALRIPSSAVPLLVWLLMI